MPNLPHSRFFFDTFSRYVKATLERAEQDEIDRTPYNGSNSIIISPEPLKFLDLFGAIGANKDKTRELFEQIVEREDLGFKKLDISSDNSGIWFNTTKKGINLRLGIEKASKVPMPIELGDRCVHGLIAGQTGSGKSVLMHNIILNLIGEYAPWELDLYLADFKRVELSKYMNNFKTPHVCACAATSEIRYVLSQINYIVDCMNARENFFKRMGIEKLQLFREMYPNIVLPRILLIVDEFQQMFLEASPKESELIRKMLTAIVKKGRATGVHIIFASQEMSHTLSASDLANFRLRICLNCNPSVSLDVLGNKAAATCARGYVMANYDDYSEKTNHCYQVPIYEDSKFKEENNQEYFDYYLEYISKLSDKYGFHKNWKYYEEDFQEDISALDMILNKLYAYRSFNMDSNFDILTLGRYVVYSSKKYDIQTLFIEKGLNKNILAVSPNVEDIAYLQMLLWKNFSTSPVKEAVGEDYKHIIYSLSPSVEMLYNIEEHIPQENKTVYRNPDDISQLEMLYKKREFFIPIYKTSKTPVEFAILNYRKNMETQCARRPDLLREREKNIPEIRRIFSGFSMEDAFVEANRIMFAEKDPIVKKIARNLQDFCTYLNNPASVFPRTIIWFNGIDVIERIPAWFQVMLKNATAHDFLFVLMATSEFDNLSSIRKTCDYIFTGGNNRRIYDRLDINYTYKDAGSIVLDLNIKSISEERSFKKYLYEFQRKTSNQIDLDAILN